MAQIAAEVFRPNSKNPKKVRVKDFLFNHVEQTPFEKMARSKAAWFAALNINPEGS